MLRARRLGCSVIQCPLHTWCCAVVEAQNKLTHEVLEQCETRSQFKDLMTKVYNYARYSCPFKRGDR